MFLNLVCHIFNGHSDMVNIQAKPRNGILTWLRLLALDPLMLLFKIFNANFIVKTCIRLTVMTKDSIFHLHVHSHRAITAKHTNQVILLNIDFRDTI